MDYGSMGMDESHIEGRFEKFFCPDTGLYHKRFLRFERPVSIFASSGNIKIVSVEPVGPNWFIHHCV